MCTVRFCRKAIDFRKNVLTRLVFDLDYVYFCELREQGMVLGLLRSLKCSSDLYISDDIPKWRLGVAGAETARVGISHETIRLQPQRLPYAQWRMRRVSSASR